MGLGQKEARASEVVKDEVIGGGLEGTGYTGVLASSLALTAFMASALLK